MCRKAPRNYLPSLCNCLQLNWSCQLLHLPYNLHDKRQRCHSLACKFTSRSPPVSCSYDIPSVICIKLGEEKEFFAQKLPAATLRVFDDCAFQETRGHVLFPRAADEGGVSGCHLVAFVGRLSVLMHEIYYRLRGVKSPPCCRRLSGERPSSTSQAFTSPGQIHP